MDFRPLLLCAVLATAISPNAIADPLVTISWSKGALQVNREMNLPRVEMRAPGQKQTRGNDARFTLEAELRLIWRRSNCVRAF